MTRMWTHLVAALALLVTTGTPAAAQPEDSEADIVVTARPTPEVIREFVGQMATSSRTTNQLSRWDRHICPGVAGLRTAYAQFVVDRLAQRALDVGLDVGEPGCDANILIIVTPEPDEVARDLVQNNPAALGYHQQRLRRTLGRRALATFVASNAPVRWWHVSRTATPDGQDVREPAPTLAPMTGNTIVSLTREHPIMMGTGSSRLSRQTHQDFGAAFVIVDAGQLEAVGFDFAALADYVAMVTLAQLDPEADTSPYPTILNLFSENVEPVRAMTEWDIAYLRGLYSMRRESRSAASQESDIARSMNDDLVTPAN